jgi:hypothetical protein
MARDHVRAPDGPMSADGKPVSRPRRAVAEPPGAARRQSRVKTLTASVAPGGARRWIAPVIVLAVVALTGAGCTGVTSYSANATGTLTVTVIESGGAPLPGGGTQQNPVAGATVHVTAAGHGGRTWSASTDHAGVATFTLDAESYLVSSPTCGSTGTVAVTVNPAQTTALTWPCPVP